MEDMASLWSYQESVDELKEKLLYTTLELQSVRAEANEEVRKNKEYAKQLLQLVKIACQERDEARDQLQKLLNKVIPASTTTPAEFCAVLSQLQPESPLLKSTKANSSITESNSLSDRSSPVVDSFFDAVSSPELSTINMADSSNLTFVKQPFVQGGTVSTSLVSSVTPKIDQASLVIDSIVKGKTLPQRGKLLQSVLEAGPLLQTLLVAGPLPQWRNPPPLQPFQIPPVSIKGCDADMLVAQKPGASISFGSKLMNSSSFVEKSCGSSQLLSTTSMLNFSGGTSGSCLGNSGRLIPAGSNTDSYAPLGKRQRFQ